MTRLSRRSVWAAAIPEHSRDRSPRPAIRGRAGVVESLGRSWPGAVELTATVEGVARRCLAAGVRCVVFGGVVDEPLPGVETIPLSGDPTRAADDLRELGLTLARNG